MQVVIELSDDDVNFLMNSSFIPVGYFETVHKALHNGTPLPKGHGRLIDADEFKNYVMDGFEESSGLFKTEEVRDLARSTAISICQDVDEMETVIPADKEGVKK